ncbi:secreted RxLR effector protein 161-like [Capsicum annuum]|uniref:secreted RxLR effector protein 161-like n=1 Tax=Capsicum annuum TaxID=4072 RepID=UPI001FB059FA|nr:secreted RxLR effector protein 161-like [Capsicum annuum]
MEDEAGTSEVRVKGSKKRTPVGTMIHQQKYVKELLKRFSMEEAMEIRTPIGKTTILDLDEKGPFMEQKLYRGMIGSLLYLTTSRPGIIFSVILYVRFQVDPNESYLKYVKRIFRYIKGTTDLGLWYPKGSNFKLVGYVDANYASYLVDRKSTTGMTHFLRSCLISWSTKKKNFAALSTAEAEYVDAGSCCA